MVNIKSGDSPSLYNLNDKGEIPYIKVEDLNNCRKYQIESRNYTQLNSKQTVPPGSVVFPKRGAAIMTNKVRLAKVPLYMDSNMMSVKADGAVLDDEYLYYTISYEKLYRIADTSTIPQINNKHIIPYKILVPPLIEQKKIAAILGCWDEGIETVEKLIAAKQKLKKGLMQQLLTDKKRFKEFEGQKWKFLKLKEVFKSVSRKNKKGIKHVLTASGQYGLVDQQDFFNRSVAGKNLEGYYLLKKGEFAYNRSLMNGYPYGAIKRLDFYDEGILSTLYLCFALNYKQADSDFYVHFFEAGLLNQQLRKICQMGARAHGLLNVITSDFFSLKVAVPSLEDQQKIASVLNAADKEIELLSDKLEALKNQKKGLMQKLLTGKIRVRV